MRKCLVALTILFACINTTLALDGLGTQASPWLIQSLTDFDEFTANSAYWSDHTRLDTDIDLTGRTYTAAPIAPDPDTHYHWNGTAFTGDFDGNGHTVSNLTIDGACFLGLFGRIDHASVTNLGMENVDISGAGTYVSGLCGWNNYGTISNCYVTGTVTVIGDEHWESGGLCGDNKRGTISHCYTNCVVSGAKAVGGLCGISEGTISNCHTTGSVTGDYKVGGLCGWNGYGTINNCYTTGAVTGSHYVGGLCGDDGNGQINDSYATGSVTGEGSLGGLCGSSYLGTINNCYATGSVTGGYNSGFLGGLCGGGDSALNNCYATGAVTAGSYARTLGGLCGIHSGINAESGPVSNCYSTGSVTAGDNSREIGGLL